MTYITPKVNANSFTCPHCGVLSKQDWSSDNWYLTGDVYTEKPVIISHCHHCQNHTLWIKDKMFYPETGNCPFPNPEMPETVKKLYLEAAYPSDQPILRVNH